jgi:hypothetical protein
MQMAMKVSFHDAKLSVPVNFSIERRLPLAAEEESDIDMVAKAGERGCRRANEKEKEREERKRRRRQKGGEVADCKSVERRKEDQCMRSEVNKTCTDIRRVPTRVCHSPSERVIHPSLRSARAQPAMS